MRAGPLLRWLPYPLLLSAFGFAPASVLADDPDPPAVFATPREMPPPPPAEIPEPPPALTEPSEGPDSESIEAPPSAAAQAAPLPDGQWVYTNQYGWVWMPYSETYTFVPNNGYPAMFLYGPRLGWRWVAAPWVFDWGPQPQWGLRGRGHFAWYAHPWFGHPASRGAAPRWHAGARAPHYGRTFRRR
jgi:hypothetical protein